MGLGSRDGRARVGGPRPERPGPLRRTKANGADPRLGPVRVGTNLEKSCPLRGSSAMQPAEAAHRARGESEQAPGAGVRAAPRGWRGTGCPRVALGTKEQNDESHDEAEVASAL